ncbi:phosphatase PAP2 family protein [Candidatus Roizmanbacteria bacterium]|nr:phosphatase PAP2 family protein [Candidatus Roizmanbacteria bacterium]
MLTLLKFDLFASAFLRIIVPKNDLLNLVFSFFSLKGNSIFIWILVIAVVVFLEEKKHPGINERDKKFIVVFLFSFLTAALLTTFVLKDIFRRPRPFYRADYSQFKLQPFVTNGCPKDFSFPSGHAATAFAAATVLVYFDKKRRRFYYIVALLISYSRIYLGCHYFFDILGGAFFGFIISKIFIKLMLKLYGKRS